MALLIDLATFNSRFGNTTRKVFPAQHFYHQEATRIQNVHARVDVMYQDHMKTLDSNYKAFWTWGNKIKNAEERKAIRDQAFITYQKQLQKVKKLKDAQPSNPTKQAELKTEEETARSMQLHLESTTK